MVLSLITLAATVPLIATSTIQLQETSQRKQDESESELKIATCHLAARATKRMSPKRHDQLRNMRVVLHEGYLYLQHKLTSTHHPFAGYFLPFPEKDYDGVVSTIDAEKMLNWIYIDSSTHRLRHGVRADAQQNLTGPMSLVHGEELDEWRLAFEGWEGFVAVEEPDKQRWALYFDKNDDGLTGKVGKGAVVEIELVRFLVDESESGDEEVD